MDTATRARWLRGFSRKKNSFLFVRKPSFRWCTSPVRSIERETWHMTTRNAPRLVLTAAAIRSTIARSPHFRTSSSNARTERAARHAPVQTGLSRAVRSESRPARFSVPEIPPDLRNAAARTYRRTERFLAAKSRDRRRHAACPHLQLGAQVEDRYAYRQRRDV